MKIYFLPNSVGEMKDYHVHFYNLILKMLENEDYSLQFTDLMVNIYNADSSNKLFDWWIWFGLDHFG